MKVEKSSTQLLNEPDCSSSPYLFYTRKRSNSVIVDDTNCMLRSLDLNVILSQCSNSGNSGSKRQKKLPIIDDASVFNQSLKDEDVFRVYNILRYHSNSNMELVKEIEQRMYRIFCDMIPFSPKALLDLLKPYSYTQQYLIAFISLHLPEFYPQDILELDVTKRSYIYILYFHYGTMIPQSPHPKYIRAVQIIQMDLLKSTEQEVDYIFNNCFAQSNTKIAIHHIHEAIAWLIGLQKLSSIWEQKWHNQINRIKDICMKYLGSHIHLYSLKELLSFFKSPEHMLSVIKSNPIPFESECYFLDFIYRAILTIVSDIIKGKQQQDLINATLLLIDYVKWKYIKASILKLFQLRLKKLSAELCQVVSVCDSFSICLEFLANVKHRLREAKCKNDITVNTSTISQYKFDVRASWDVHNLLHVVCSKSVVDKPVILNLKSSKRESSTQKICGNSYSAIYNNTCKVLDFDYQIRKTRRSEVQPTVCLVTQNYVESYLSNSHQPSIKSQSSDDYISWALQLDSCKISTSYREPIYLPEKISFPLRLIVDRLQDKIYIINNSTIYADSIPLSKFSNIPLYPVITFNSGFFITYFNSYHPELPLNVQTLLESSTVNELETNYKIAEPLLIVNVINNKFKFKNKKIDNLVLFKEPSHASPCLFNLISSFKYQQTMPRDLQSSKTLSSRRSENKSILYQAVMNKIGFHSAIKLICRPIKLTPGAPKRYSLSRKFNSISQYTNEF